jgi:hypothetical protein
LRAPRVQKVVYKILQKEAFPLAKISDQINTDRAILGYFTLIVPHWQHSQQVIFFISLETTSQIWTYTPRALACVLALGWLACSRRRGGRVIPPLRGDGLGLCGCGSGGACSARDLRGKSESRFRFLLRLILFHGTGQLIGVDPDGLMNS